MTAFQAVLLLLAQPTGLDVGLCGLCGDQLYLYRSMWMLLAIH